MLDIVSSDDSQIVYSVSPGLPLDHSDHVSVNFTLGLQSFVTPNVCSLSNSVTKYAWRKADCESLAVYLHSIDWYGLICLNPSAQCAWEAFSTVLILSLATRSVTGTLTQSGVVLQRKDLPAENIELTHQVFCIGNDVKTVSMMFE